MKEKGKETHLPPDKALPCAEFPGTGGYSGFAYFDFSLSIASLPAS